MANQKEQLPLSLARNRVALDEDDDEEVRVRVPTAVAKAINADPSAAVRALAAAGEKMLAEITSSGATVGQNVVDGQLRVARGGDQGWPINEDPTYFTAWETRKAPEWDGFYDVTDSRTGTLSARWWFSRSAGPMSWNKDWHNAMPKVAPLYTKPEYPRADLMHDEFIDQCYAWRGLRSHPVDPYPCPPYWPPNLPPKAAVDGKYLKRTRVEAE